MSAGAGYTPPHDLPTSRSPDLPTSRSPDLPISRLNVELTVKTEPEREIFIFPLNTVLFPDGLLPLKVFEQRYIEMTKACLRDERAFGVCLIKEGREVLAAIIEKVGAERFPAPLGMDDAAWIGYRLAELLPLEARVKQELLEITDAAARLERLRALLVQQGTPD